MRDELESPVRPSFADELPSLDEAAGADDPPLEEAPIAASRREAGRRPRGGGKVDGRVLIGVAALVLVGVAAAAWFLFRPQAAPPAPPLAARAARGDGPAPQDPLEKAQALFKQGKVDEALGILTAIPASDPRHDQALVLIDQFKSSAAAAPCGRTRRRATPRSTRPASPAWRASRPAATSTPSSRSTSS